MHFLCKEGKLSHWAEELIATVKTKENYCFSKELMEELSDKEDTSELMAIMGMKEMSQDKLNSAKVPFFVLFDRPSNKGNLGSIIRSCDALGADGLLCGLYYDV